jgi:SpoIID/LytB domain protein
MLDLTSRRVVAESRPDILDTAVAPGSVMKVFTLVAAMERGLIDDHTRITCTRTIDVDGQRLTCVHPDLHRSLSASEALGHSCNVFFATVARRLSASDLNAVLTRVGLPPVRSGTPVASAALGLAGVRATPRDLLDAFVRLVTPGGVQSLSVHTRATLVGGLRLAATSGTAQAFRAAGLTALAKTGTAPMPQGGYQGLVVAVAPDPNPSTAVVVLVPGGAGADAAQYAAGLLLSRGRTVRVGITRPSGGYDVETMPIETYVSRVVAGEMGAKGPEAAMEAMALVARTYAEVNRGRHSEEGFDLCDLTHCQVVGKSSTASDAAARATAGRVLLWEGKPATVYFSSWCGGYTEQPSRVWPSARNVPYLPAAPDPDCAKEPPWTSTVAEPELRRALTTAGMRGNGIARLDVVERDQSGRAVLVRASGMVPGTISGTEFQLAVGRTLGWQVLKSTLFKVRRVAAGFEFTGKGLGHGVGLCIRGASAKAAAGASRDAILAAYFPGPTVGPLPAEIRILLPELDRRDTDAARAVAQTALADVARRLGVDAPAAVSLRFHPTVESYRRATGLPWWTVARTMGTTIDLTPLAVLRQHETLASALRHEFVHVMTDDVLEGRPLWIKEGLALVIAGEHRPSAADARAACPSDDELRASSSLEAWRRAYEAAGACVARQLARGVSWRDLR